VLKKVKKVLFIIITLILVLVLAFNIYNFVSIKILKKDFASIKGYAILEVVSGSMEPTIKVGDLIVIDTKVQKYKEQDIVTFRDVNGSFVTHRIISLDKDKMITKGDNNNTKDEALSTKNIVGKYVFKISGVGLILSSLKSPFVLVMVLLIGILVCYLISTDKNGKPLLEDDELNEFIEFQKSKEEKKDVKNKKEKLEDKKKTLKKESDSNIKKPKTSKKEENKSESKKSTAKKTDTSKKVDVKKTNIAKVNKSTKASNSNKTKKEESVLKRKTTAKSSSKSKTK